MRQANRTRSPTDVLGDELENLLQREIVAAENVALAGPARVQRGKMTLRDVVRYYSTLEGRTPPGPHDEKILVPLRLNEQESADLIAFLESLTGEPLPADLLRRPETP